MIKIIFDSSEQIINSQWFRMFCLIIGIISIVATIIYFFMRFVIFLYFLWKSRRFKWCGGINTWAVVTGSTEGIGLAYAKQLYQRDYNLLLISRSQQKLEKVKEEIQTKFGFKRKVRSLAIDFSQCSDEIYDTIETEFESLDEIHVLVNNVGTNYPNERPEYFTQIPNLKSVIMNLINVNMTACTRLTALVLPRMEKRGRGIIINLSSYSALFPTPLLTLYSATKVYIDYLSRGLQEEYRSKGIIIQSVLPYYVSTRMTYNMKPTFYAPTPDEYVRHAIQTVGREERTAGYFVHTLWGFITWYCGIWFRLIGIDFNIKFAYYRLRAIRNRIRVKEGPLITQTTQTNQEERV